MNNFQFHIDIEQFLDSFQYMGLGMLGIFVVTIVIMLVIKLLAVVTNREPKKAKSPDNQKAE